MIAQVKDISVSKCEYMLNQYLQLLVEIVLMNLLNVKFWFGSLEVSNRRSIANVYKGQQKDRYFDAFRRVQILKHENWKKEKIKIFYWTFADRM